MSENRRYTPQRLPGHANYTVWDTEKRTFVTTEDGSQIIKFPSQGTALARAIRLNMEDAAAKAAKASS